MNKKVVRWIVINGFALALVLLAYIVPNNYQQIASNLFTFFNTAFFLLAFSVLLTICAGSYGIDIIQKEIKKESKLVKFSRTFYAKEAKKDLKEHLKWQEVFKFKGAVYNSIDLTFDSILLILIVGSGHFVVGTIYAGTICMHQITKSIIKNQISVKLAENIEYLQEIVNAGEETDLDSSKIQLN